MENPLLAVNNLNAFFYNKENGNLTQSLFDISFQLHKGETLGIIGESGSGKTITLLSLLGLVDAEPGICRGEIIYHNEESPLNVLGDISDIVKIKTNDQGVSEIQKDKTAWMKNIEPRYKKVRGSKVAMIFQNPRLAFNPYISIGKQINETIRLHTSIKDKKKAKEKTIEWLSAVKMDAPHIRYNNNPYGLSGGMCQRALIAMALSSESDIIIADEPTSGLDATIQSDILDLLMELKKTYSKSLIIVSHDLAVMKKITDNILVYYKGHIVESGASSDILKNQKNINHPYTLSLINANALNFEEDEQTSETTDTPGCPYVMHCKYAKEVGIKCHEQAPPLKAVTNASHKIACWRINRE